jgi:hypothetical protein
MAKGFMVKITTTDHEVRIYTSKHNTQEEALYYSGLAYRLAGNDTDKIEEICIREIR